MNDPNRAHFERLAPAFAAAETDEVPSAEVAGLRIDEANAARASAGRVRLAEEPVDPPELNLYRRARALGHRRRRG